MPVPRITALLCALGTAMAAAAQPGSPTLLDPAFVPLAQEPEAPAAMLRLDPMEDLSMLDETLAAAFPDGLPADEETLALEMLAHVAQVMRLGQLGTRLATEALRAGEGSCTDFAVAFSGLCRRAGLPARMTHFHNFGWMQGHSAVEVHYGGGWHFMDPTFGTFFYSRAGYDRQGRILSLRELHGAPPGTVEHCFAVTAHLWAGERKQPATPEPAADRRAGRHKYTLRNFYTQLFIRSFPPVYGNMQLVATVFDVDLEEAEIWIGERDGHGSDLFDRQPDGEYPRYRGFPQLGATRHFGVFHTFTFQNATPGWHRLTYHFFGSSRFGQIGVVPLKSVLPRSSETGKESWSVLFYLQDADGILLVANPGGLAYVDAVHIAAVDNPPPED